MPVTLVSIVQITPNNQDVTITWQSDDRAGSATIFVALTPADLSNPAKRFSAPAQNPLPDIFFFATVTGLTPGTTYVCMAEADGVNSAVQNFTTGGTAPGGPIFSENIAVGIDSLVPLTLSFTWRGPNTPKGRVFIGTASGNLNPAGEDTTPGEVHRVSVSNLQPNQLLFCKVASVDAGGAVVAESDEFKFATPKAANNNLHLTNPVGIPFISDNSISGGGRSTVSVGVREGGNASSNHLVEFKLVDPSFGKLGYSNVAGNGRVQLISDPRVFESVTFISNGKAGNALVEVRGVGSSHPNAVKRASIQVT